LERRGLVKGVLVAREILEEIKKKN